MATVRRALRALPTTGPTINPPPDSPGETVRGDFPSGWGASDYLTLQFAIANDGITPWGRNLPARDRQLREFWPTEPLFAGAMFTKISQYTTVEYDVQGPEDHVSQVMDIFESCEDGAGYMVMMNKFLCDQFSQDNGAFLEIIRTEDDPNAPVVTMNHLDAGCCTRTGNRFEPVWYLDPFTGQLHKLKWYQVAIDCEMPSPIARMRGAQYCVLTRLLTAAQIMKNIEVYHREKTGGQFSKEVHFVGGIAKKQIEESLARQQAQDMAGGLTRMAPAVIIAGLDPTRQVSLETIEFAKLPEGFDLEQWTHYYFTQFALAWGGDFQDFAPLTSRGSSGSSGGQSALLHTKSRGKGLGNFLARMTHKFNFHGIMPQTCRFIYGEQDKLDDLDAANIQKARAQVRQIRIMSGEITPENARQIAHDDGDLTDDQFAEAEADPNKQTVLPQKFPGGPPNTLEGGRLPSPAGGSQPAPGPNVVNTQGNPRRANA